MHFFYSKTDRAASVSRILDEFEFINDFGFEEYKDIRQKPLAMHFNEGIEICYVTKGRYEWVVGDKSYLLFPGDGFVTCPWQMHGSPREVVDLGEIYWIVIKPFQFSRYEPFYLGSWSRFSKSDSRLIGNVLAENSKHTISQAKFLKPLFISLKNELENLEFGYYQRICNLIEEFLITSVRAIQSVENQMSENRNWFLNFNSMLMDDVARKWSLHEMAVKSKVGITTLTQYVKEHTGYTPANYLISIRLEKAKNLINNTSKRLTDIALECGFYSSQHFSSTFSKWVGITPKQFREKKRLE